MTGAVLRRRLVTVAAAGLVVLAAPPAFAQGPAGSSTGSDAVDATFETLCTPTEPELEEISGLASDGARMFAIGDSGTDREVWVLGDYCRVTGSLTVPGVPVDVEDLALVDSRIWLSDTGDNNRVRASVALTGIDPDTGTGSSHALVYPDTAHDAEALLVGADGRPVIVTKELLGAAGIYTADQSLDDLPDGPTTLRRAGQVRLGPTDTPGGPVPAVGSTLVTGGAVSADGRIVALRTYTDIYLFPAPDRDIVAALTGAEPIRVPMPNQPQGEAVAFTPDGDLLSASEANGGPLQPIQVLWDATALVPLPAEERQVVAATVDGGVNRTAVTAAAVGVGAAALGGALLYRTRRG
ncbi:hypothetical protein ACFYVR_02820 [Rhodococcus sp. NPDC003318]|uniref:hypothetical protein n=1 Tax=Rhodococcus sp. NPDC003318 TaxID=3364503 RepID=UPI0036781826